MTPTREPLVGLAERLREVTQADRERAADYISAHWYEEQAFAHKVRSGSVDSAALVVAFARHRATAIEEHSRRVEELEAAITMALQCTPSIGSQYVGLAGMAYRPVIQYDCGDPWAILRTALSPSDTVEKP